MTTTAIDGAGVLDRVEKYLGRFVAYPSEHARVAHVLWIAHTHRMPSWESTPRIAFLSPEPGSGKSRALEVTEPLVPFPVHAVNTTPAYLFRKVADPEGAPTILFDEVDTVFGPRAKDNEEIRGLLNAGHRRGAVAGRCVVVGKVVQTEELPAYCAVALAGLDDLPDTLMSRSVVVRMRRRSPTEEVESFRHRLHAPQGHEVRKELVRWSESTSVNEWPEIPCGVEDRDADVWEALLAVADLAGGEWPVRARRAAVTLVTATKSAGPSMGVRLLSDLKSVFDGTHCEEAEAVDRLFTDDVLSALNGMELAPWGDIRGKALDARSLARRLSKYGVHPHSIRDGEKTAKGYTREDLADPWSRYVPVEPADPESFGEATEAATEPVGPPHLANVTSVTTSQESQFSNEGWF